MLITSPRPSNYHVAYLNCIHKIHITVFNVKHIILALIYYNITSFVYYFMKTCSLHPVFFKMFKSQNQFFLDTSYKLTIDDLYCQYSNQSPIYIFLSFKNFFIIIFNFAYCINIILF